MLIIDRFEGEYAVIETDKGTVNIPKSDMPTECREGDIILIQIDKNGTINRKKRIKGLMNNLFKE
ncbi:MAG: DUF3006 domain-containing protein [Peptococcaceae bacterium]|nr:DUF3006 domain-containing protein [Peptococcaceae bacterium]